MLPYAIFGIVLSLAGSGFALSRARHSASFYALDVYHMTTRSHRRFAALSALFALGFMLALRWLLLTYPLLAVYTLLLVLYGASFARGFSDDI